MDRDGVKRAINREMAIFAWGFVIYLFVFLVRTVSVASMSINERVLVNKEATLFLYHAPFWYLAYLCIRLGTWMTGSFDRKRVRFYRVAVEIVLLIFVLTYALTAMRSGRVVNNDIYPAFRGIENYCEDYLAQKSTDPREYARCESVVAFEGQVRDNELASIKAYYKKLKKLGFELPPLYVLRGERSQPIVTLR